MSYFFRVFPVSFCTFHLSCAVIYDIIKLERGWKIKPSGGERNAFMARLHCLPPNRADCTAVLHAVFGRSDRRLCAASARRRPHSALHFALVLQEEDGVRILLLYDPISQGFRCAVSLSSDPAQVLYSPSVHFNITPGHPLTIRYPDAEQEEDLQEDVPAVDTEESLLPVEVCITPRVLTTSRTSQYTSESFVQEWHVRWKELEDGVVWA